MDASTTRASLLALSLITIGGCDPADTGPVDGRDDAFLVPGKADGAISEDSPEARAVLALANAASFEQLDDSDEVGLDIRAADGIYGRRVGADGVAETEDDVPFETLAELDAVPWVGPSAFRKMKAYALEHGYGEASTDEEPDAPDPWSDEFCSDGPLPSELGRQYRDTAIRTFIPMLEHGVRTHERRCNPDTGECGSWQLVDSPNGEPAVLGRYRGGYYTARAPELEEDMTLWAGTTGLFVQAGLGSLALVLHSPFDHDHGEAYLGQGIGLGVWGSLEDTFEIRSAPGCLRWESYRARMAPAWTGITGEFPAHEVRSIGYALFDSPPE